MPWNSNSLAASRDEGRPPSVAGILAACANTGPFSDLQAAPPMLLFSGHPGRSHRRYEWMTGFEPATCTLARCRATSCATSTSARGDASLIPCLCGANRTVPPLGSRSTWSPTTVEPSPGIEPRPSTYQGGALPLSYEGDTPLLPGCVVSPEPGSNRRPIAYKASASSAVLSGPTSREFTLTCMVVGGDSPKAGL